MCEARVRDEAHAFDLSARARGADGVRTRHGGMPVDGEDAEQTDL